jgi:hypothetical protein
MKTFDFDRLSYEGSHDPHPDNLAPENGIDVVEPFLHEPELRDHPQMMTPRMTIRRGRLTASSQDMPRSCRIAMNTRKRRSKARPPPSCSSQHQHLDLLNVVGDSSDK